MIAVIFGSTSGIGDELAQKYVCTSDAILLIGRNKDLLSKQKKSLSSNGKKVYSICCDLSNNFDPNKIFKIMRLYNEVELYFIAGGVVKNDNFKDNVNINVNYLYHLNFYYQYKMISLVYQNTDKFKYIGINIFSSIASSRGRSNNIVYSFFKRGLISLYESSRHAAINDYIKVRCFILGYIDTPNARLETSLLPKSSYKLISKKIFNHRNSSSGIFYLPFFWIYILHLIKITPWFIFKRIKF